MLLYYTILGLYLLIAVVFSYVVGISPEMLIDPQSTLGQVLQYVTIFYIVGSIPSCLYWLRSKPALQMLLIAIGGLVALVLFYFMGRYMSMLYLAGMAIIAHVFTKNNALNQQNEL